MGGDSSKDYPGYDALIAKLKQESFDTQVASGAAWVGTPDDLIERVRAFREDAGPFEIASLQVNFNVIPYADAAHSMTLFGEKVIPEFQD